jgi:hypothetical protein
MIHSLLILAAICQQSPLVEAAAIYPGVRFQEGTRDAALVAMAQDAADTMARRGDRAYRFSGHPGWDGRFRRINAMGLRGVEVSAFSWPDTSPEPTPEILRELFFDWQRSPGHWRVVSTPHARYGDGLARSRTGTWFAAVIVADPRQPARLLQRFQPLQRLTRGVR